MVGFTMAGAVWPCGCGPVRVLMLCLRVWPCGPVCVGGVAVCVWLCVWPCADALCLHVREGGPVAGPPLCGVQAAVSYSPTPWRVQYHRRWQS